MAQPGAFVPAWKRLGLKLKNFQEPESNHQTIDRQTDESIVQNGSDLHQDRNVGQTTQGQVKLGKRKHDSGTADVEGASVKKSKHDWANGPTAGHTVVVPEVEPESLTPATSEAPPADEAQPKGDPNYRKKKGGDSNYRKKKEKEPKRAQNSYRSSLPSVVSHEQSLSLIHI